MKLQIEKWVEETRPFSSEVLELFNEAVTDYKIGSYRSAFIMSYLSFKLTIRERIISCNYGHELDDFDQASWEKDILIPLKNDDKWENKVNDIVIASCSPKDSRSKFGILNFNNGETSKTEYTYWKNTRNTCVHGKSGTINSSTVEAFWNYLMDNLCRFYVLGGEDYLLTNLIDIYTYYKYPNISSRDQLAGILSDISTVYQDDVCRFFEEFFKRITIDRTGIADEYQSFWTQIIRSPFENIRDGFIKSLAVRGDIFYKLYPFFSELLGRLVDNDSKFIVTTLSDWLADFSDWYVRDYSIFWAVLIDALSKYGDQVDINKIFTDNNLHFVRYLREEAHNIALLNQYGVFKKMIFDVSSWFFKTDASTQYENSWKYQSNYMDIETCFSYLEWDPTCLQKLEVAISTLNNSLAGRTNWASQQRGVDTLCCFGRIVTNCKTKIEQIAGEDKECYKNIFNLLKPAEAEDPESLASVQEE